MSSRFRSSLGATTEHQEVEEEEESSSTSSSGGGYAALSAALGSASGLGGRRGARSYQAAAPVTTTFGDREVGGGGEEDEEAAAAAVSASSSSSRRTRGRLSTPGETARDMPASHASSASSDAAVSEDAEDRYYPTQMGGRRRGRGRGKAEPKPAAVASATKLETGAPHLQPRQRFSSTASMFYTSTISAPKENEVISVVARYICRKVLDADDEFNSSSRLPVKFTKFDETKHPLRSPRVDLAPPSAALVESFILEIFKIGQLAPEAIILAIVFLERLRSAELQVGYITWRRALLITLILGAKVWEDQAVFLRDFLDLFPYATTKDLASLELTTMQLLNHEMQVDRTDFARVYFDLRSQANLDQDGEFANLGRLDSIGLAHLEARSAMAREAKLGGAKQLAKSFDFGGGALIADDNNL